MTHPWPRHKRCGRCDGSGFVPFTFETTYGIERTDRTCPTCGGTGEKQPPAHGELQPIVDAAER